VVEIKERPILFTGPMVRALLAGIKTQTRRMVKPSVKGCTVGAISSGNVVEPVNVDEDGGPWDAIRCPYGASGDRLWVREKFREIWIEPDMHKIHLHYAADGHDAIPLHDGDGFQEWNKDGSEKFIPWRPSIHMPRKLSRIDLEITDVRVQRLQEISQDDAVAEGCDDISDMKPLPGRVFYAGGPRDAYRVLWEEINGKGTWDANPWVWALSFKNVTT
jgi:hypothetical protein